MQNLPEVIAAFSFFGAVVVCPLVYLMMRHQRTIADMQHRGGSTELHNRVQRLEQEVMTLRAAEHSRILAEDDRARLRERAS